LLEDPLDPKSTHPAIWGWVQKDLRQCNEERKQRARQGEWFWVHLIAVRSFDQKDFLVSREAFEVFSTLQRSTGGSILFWLFVDGAFRFSAPAFKILEASKVGLLGALFSVRLPTGYIKGTGKLLGTNPTQQP
jgi:hypothetical protein